MNDTALGDLKVIDLTQHIAGPCCTKLLADFGADVIKVERVGGGDRARRMGPFPGHKPHPEKSGIFLYLNTNKRGVILDLKSDAGRTSLLVLVRDADVLVESYSPRVMPSLGLDYQALTKVNPKLVPGLSCHGTCALRPLRHGVHHGWLWPGAGEAWL